MIINLDGSVSAPRKEDDLFVNFLKSTVSAIPETFGTDPVFKGVEQFRRDNPWLGVGSEIAGMAVPYTGWFKVAKGIKSVMKGADIAEALMGGAKAAPILSGAARAMAIDAPFEIGRTAISTQTGDNTSKIATDAATNLAVAGAFGAVGGAIRAGGRKVSNLEPEIDKAVNLDDPTPLQLRSLKQAKVAQQVTSPDGAEFWINRLSDAVRREVPYKVLENGGYEARPILGTLEGVKDPSRLDRIWRMGKNGNTLRAQRFVPEDWSSDAAYNDALSKSGLLGKEDYIQFPRLVTATGKGLEHTESAVTSTLTQVGPDTWMNKEANDGLFVMAKRVAQRAEKGKAPQQEWMLWKTDSPGRFLPLGDAWTKSLESMAKWAPDTTKPIGTPINDALQSMMQQFPLQNYNDVVAEGRLGSLHRDLKAKFGVGTKNGAAKQAAESLYEFAKAHVAPAQFQFSSSPRAAYIFNMARNTFQYADAEAKKILEGEAQTGKSLWHQVLKGTESSGQVGELKAVFPLIDDLDEKSLGELWLARALMWEPKRVHEAVISGEIGPKAAEAIRTMNALDSQQFQNVVKTQEAFGLNISRPSVGHMMIANTWKGTVRAPVLDADGKLVTLASGNNRAEALAEADAMIKGGELQGFKWKVDDTFHADPGTELQQLLNGARNYKIDLGSRQFQVANALRVAQQRMKMRPATLRERHGIGGYQGQYTPWSKQELKDIVAAHVNGYQRYQARMNVENVLGDQMIKLMTEDPAMYGQIKDRMNDLAGVPSASSQIINRIADASPLGAVLGKDSASKSVATLNGITHHMQLGMGNLSFPLINAMQPLITTMPQLAFVLRASAEDMARAGYYSWNLAGDAAGKPRAGAGILNMFKIMGKSFEEMRAPSKDLDAHLAQAAREGQWSHTFHNEVVGPNAAIGNKLRNVIEGKEGLTGALVQWSNMLPNISERFSRVQSFTLGHIVGRDFLNLKNDQLYRFAKRFTENSNFSYSTADRARVITGPLGNLAGLYKNWQMHYVGWMMNYLGQGMKQGNWAPLLWQLGGTAATGGIGAMPLYSVADGISKMVSDKDLMQHVYANFGSAKHDDDTISDGVYFGLPAFLGFSLQSQAAAPTNNPVRDASMLFSLVQYNRMKDMGLAIGNAWDQYQVTGENPMHSPLVRDNVMKAMAPRSLARYAQTVEDGFVRSLNTSRPTASANAAERVLYAIGLNPVDVEKQLIVSDKLWRDQTAMRNAVQAYGKALEAADGNADDTRAIMLRAMADGVPLDSIIRSSKSRQARASQSMLDRQFNPLKVKGYEDVLGK